MSLSEPSTTAALSDNGLVHGPLIFDEEYYRLHLGPEPYDRSNVGMLNFFSGIADEIIRSLQPRTVLDAGCAMGFLVEAFWDRGVAASGVDISEYAISRVRRDIQPYCRAASLTEPIPDKYDLVVCIEVLEHMPPAETLQAMDRLTAVTDTILFSSTSTDFEESTHVNVRQPIWWVDQFLQRGFAPDLTFDAGFVTPKAMLLRRSSVKPDWQTQRLYCDWLRYKYAVTERDRTAHSSRALIAELQGTSARLAAQIDTIAREHETALEAERQRHEAAIGALTAALDDSRRDCGALEQKIAAAGEMPGRSGNIGIENGPDPDFPGDTLSLPTVVYDDVRFLSEGAFGFQAANDQNAKELPQSAMREALQSLIGKHALLLGTVEDLARQRDQILRNLESGGRAGSVISPPGDSNVLSDDGIADLLLQVSTLNRTQQGLQAAVSGLKTQVSDIISSRIWKTLVQVGGIILRFLPGGRN
jgi:2-polyprenyl-3-methyl-5-hydroxy-6-metoxy-1,4-benzoquinol methylase